jgi:hypothetical protein
MSPEFLFFGMLAVMIGWPMLQLGSVLIRRSKAARLEFLPSKLEIDPKWNREERDAIARVVASARTSSRNWVLPLFVIAAGPIVVATILRQYRASNGSKHRIDGLLEADIASLTLDRFNGNMKLIEDDRLRELST